MVPMLTCIRALAIIAVLAATAFADDPALEKAIDEYRYSTALLSSYDVWFQSTTTTKLQLIVDPATNKRHYTPYRDEGVPPLMVTREHQTMMRFVDRLIDRYQHVNEVIDPAPLRSLLAYDGRSFVLKRPGRLTIGADSPEELTHGAFDYSQLYLNAVADTSFAEVFERRTKIIHVNDAGSPQSFVIEIPPEENSARSEWGFRIWLNPQNGYLPTRIDRMFHNIDTVRERVEITKFEKCGNGLKVPIKAKIRRFDMDRESRSFGQEIDEIEIGVNLETSTWNQQIDFSTFSPIDLAPGTTVNDLVNRRAWNVPAPGEAP